jgi:hypothetical protein
MKNVIFSCNGILFGNKIIEVLIHTTIWMNLGAL